MRNLRFLLTCGWVFAACFAFVAIGAGQTTTKPAATAPAPLAVPDAAACKKSLDLIKTLFKDDYAKAEAADRVKLAGRLLQQAVDTRDDLVARYVLFEQAGDLAAQGGDAALVVKAVDQLSFYAIDALDVKARLLTRALASAQQLAVGSAEACQGVATVGLDTMDLATAADRFDKAAIFAGLAETAANRSQKVAFAASVQPRLADYKALANEYARVQRALKTLAANADEPEANLIAGKYYCLVKGDFAKGLPYLAKGSEAPLRTVAEKELAGLADSAQEIEVADAWWELASRSAGPARENALAHSRQLYQLARAHIKGFTLTKIEARLKSTGGSETSVAGNVINLLALIDPVQDKSIGEWQVKNNALRCDITSHACVQIPYQAPSEYDLAVTFARTNGDGPVAIFLTGRSEPFGLTLDNQGHHARLETVNRKISADNPTKTPCTLVNNKSYTVVVQIRRDSITALLDGKQLLQWKTDYKDMGHYSAWKLKDTKLLGVGASASEVTFSKIELTPITGEGRKVR